MKKTRRAARKTASRATGAGRPGRSRRTTRSPKRASTSKGGGTRRTRMNKRSGGGGRGKNAGRDMDMMTRARKGVRKAADAAMGMGRTAIERIRP